MTRKHIVISPQAMRDFVAGKPFHPMNVESAASARIIGSGHNKETGDLFAVVEMPDEFDISRGRLPQEFRISQ